MHVLAPLREYIPAAQEAQEDHDELPVEDRYLPAEQDKQIVALELLWKFPTEHDEQIAAPSAEYDPDGQLVQAVAPVVDW